jgi:lysophospholipase L1-like esterase
VWKSFACFLAGLLVAILGLFGTRFVRPHQVKSASPVLTIPVPAYPTRHQAFLRALQRRACPDVPAVFLGDSITDLWRDVPDLWDANFPGAVNLGVSWERVQNVLWRVQNGELDPHLIRPRLIVLLVGINNLQAGDSPEAVTAGVRAVLQEIRFRQPSARILLLGIFPSGPKANSLRSAIAQTNRLLADLTTEEVSFLDLGAIFLCTDESIDLGLLPDEVHPSPTGYQRWGEAMLSPYQNLSASR